MIKPRFILFSLVATLLAACSGKDDGLEMMLRTADFYPVKTVGANQWRMLSVDGTVMLPDSFTLAPTVALDGIFSAYGPKGIAVYSIDTDGGLHIIADSLRYAGAMAANCMPVCSRGGAISVIDNTGATLFSLDNLAGRNFNASAGFFSCGLLPVREASTNLWGAITADGTLAIDPVYDYLSTFNDGYAIAKREGMLCIVNRSGDAKSIEGDYDIVTANFIHNHAIISRHKEGTRCILDTDGHVATLGSSLVPLMLCSEGSIFLNNMGELGVIDWEGETSIVAAKRELLMPISCSDRLLALSDSIFSVLEADGSEVGHFPQGLARIDPLYGNHGFAAQSHSIPVTIRLFGSDLNPIPAPQLSAISRALTLNDIILSDREEDHQLFNSADPGDELPEWLDDESEEDTDTTQKK